MRAMRAMERCAMPINPATRMPLAVATCTDLDSARSPSAFGSRSGPSPRPPRHERPRDGRLCADKAGDLGAWPDRLLRARPPTRYSDLRRVEATSGADGQQPDHGLDGPRQLAELPLASRLSLDALGSLK